MPRKKAMTGAEAGNLYLEYSIAPLVRNKATLRNYPLPSLADVNKAESCLKTENDRVVFQHYKEYGDGLADVIRDYRLHSQTVFHAYYRIQNNLNIVQNRIQETLDFEAVPIISSEAQRSKAVRNEYDKSENEEFTAAHLFQHLFSWYADPSMNYRDELPSVIVKQIEALKEKPITDKGVIAALIKAASMLDEDSVTFAIERKEQDLILTTEGQRRLFSAAKAGKRIALTSAEKKKALRFHTTFADFPGGASVYDVAIGKYSSIMSAILWKDGQTAISYLQAIMPEAFQTISELLLEFDQFPRDYFTNDKATVTWRTLKEYGIAPDDWAKEDEERPSCLDDDIITGEIYRMRGFLSHSVPYETAVTTPHGLEQSEYMHKRLLHDLETSPELISECKTVVDNLLLPSLRKVYAALQLVTILCTHYPFELLQTSTAGEDSLFSNIVSYTENKFAGLYCYTTQLDIPAIKESILEKLDLLRPSAYKPSKATITRAELRLDSLTLLPKANDIRYLYSVLSKEA